MNLSQHKAHRNDKYLAWLRTQNCVVSDKKAQCAHHIRLGTNGGTGIKPSDYFCIPLTNDNHTTGSNALHMIGEDTFLTEYDIDKEEIFIYYLSKFIKETMQIKVPRQSDAAKTIELLIKTIEETRAPQTKKRASTKDKKIDPYYEKSKEIKRESDKILRAKIKASTPKVKSTSITENEFDQLAKEEKRIRDKELRRQLKDDSKQTIKKSITENPFYQKAKEAKRLRDKELRQKIKDQKKK